MKKRTIMSWSSGKDSAWTLFQLLQNPDIEVVGLCCTINKEAQRVAMHGVNVELVKQQAERLNIPLDLVELPFPCDNQTYLEIMANYVDSLTKREIEVFAFGDIFLEDVKLYREQMLAGTNIEAIFPLWGSNTSTLSKEMVKSEFKTVITCIDPSKLPESLIGSDYNSEFIASLPEGVDPCGENGEFHSFVYAAPMFPTPIEFKKGDRVNKEGFLYVDLIP